jgi:hypothetical protein
MVIKNRIAFIVISQERLDFFRDHSIITAKSREKHGAFEPRQFNSLRKGVLHASA